MPFWGTVNVPARRVSCLVANQLISAVLSPEAGVRFDERAAQEMETQRMPSPNLRLVAARLALDLLRSDEMVRVADDLLSTGVYAYPLGELATTRYPVMTEVGPLFTAALKELGVCVPSREEAARTLVEPYLCEIAEGAAPSRPFRCLMAEIYPHHWFDGTGSFIADSAGCGELISLVSEYEEIELLNQDGILSDEAAGGALSDLDRRVREFAAAWVHANIRVDIEPGWLTWNSACVARLAERIQAGRHFEDLPVLARSVLVWS
jgi:hypothetical protein